MKLFNVIVVMSIIGFFISFFNFEQDPKNDVIEFANHSW